jgi:dolichyl-phosphate beta-glucosyltransferase
VDQTLSVIIPAYNEERRLPTTLQAIAAYLAMQPYASEIMVVDDGSSDRTVAVAERQVIELEGGSAARVTLRVIRNAHRGKAVAVRTGMLAARGRYVLFTDADLAVPIEEWDKLKVCFDEGADVVIASREGLGARRLGEPRYRHLMGRIFNGVVRAVALGGIQDTQCGFKAFTAEAAQRIFRSVQLYGDHARAVRGPAVTAFDVEVLFLARSWGYRIREVPVTWRYGEETKVDPLADSIRNFADVMKVRWNAVRGKYKTAPAATAE